MSQDLTEIFLDGFLTATKLFLTDDVFEIFFLFRLNDYFRFSQKNVFFCLFFLHNGFFFFGKLDSICWKIHTRKIEFLLLNVDIFSNLI